MKNLFSEGHKSNKCCLNLMLRKLNLEHILVSLLILQPRLGSGLGTCIYPSKFSSQLAIWPACQPTLLCKIALLDIQLYHFGI